MEKKSWDDIPSLEGLDVDWGYKPVTPLGKRSFVRIKLDEICELFEAREILVKVATTEKTYTARLLDISEGGLSLGMPALLEENRPVKVGFFLGTTKIISKAMVRHIRKNGEVYTTGVKFVDLNPEAAEYIRGLYASKVLRQTY